MEVATPMLDSLRQLMMKSSPEQVLDVVEQGQRDRQVRLDTEEKARQQAILDGKLAELSALDARITLAIQQKALLQARIQRHLHALIPDLEALDQLEIAGSVANSRAFTLQQETHQPLTSRWRDPVLPACASLAKRWLNTLEG